MFDNSIYYIFYNLFYGIGTSVLFLLLILRKENANLEAVGIKKLGARQIVVLALFVAFSVGGQIVPKVASGEMLRWNVLPVAILPLVMTTFFEEFLFRGFLQTRLEKQFGAVIAIIVSGLLFALYHIGYPGFRTASDILLLFAVGIGFAVSFKLAENNLIVSYFVNLPNAFVTYILKCEQFPRMTILSTIFAGITIILIAAILFAMKIKEMK
ncbi:MAG: CPBP family intramembrane metalloprotease [Treponema sp.]|nr:CPBP family intramembrane metalloprotease [Treponema sp.]